MSDSEIQENKIVPEFSELQDDNKFNEDKHLLEHVPVKTDSNMEIKTDTNSKIINKHTISDNKQSKDDLYYSVNTEESFSSNNKNEIKSENDENQNIGDVKPECNLDKVGNEISKANPKENFQKGGDESRNESTLMSKGDLDINQNINKGELRQSVVHNLSLNYENSKNEIEKSDNITSLETNNISHETSLENKSNDLAQSNIENKQKIEETNQNIDLKLLPDVQNSILTESNKIQITDESNEKNIENTKDDKGFDRENFVDILGNGLLTKKIIHYGLGRETRPTHGDSVTIQYRGWNSSGELIEDKEATFVLGDGDMIQAFDLGICLAEKHEEFELKTDARFAYGTYGWEPYVQANETLVYRIKLLNVDDPPDYTTFTYQGRMEAADVKRERGNYLYRREEYSLAVNSYSRAIKIIQTDPDYKKASTDPSRADMYDLFVKVTNNLAAAQLKLESYDNVIETCNTILNYDASNVKALFRKGKSLTMKGNYDEAIPILKRALELENSKLIAGEIQKCYQLKRAEDEQRARVCRKMFGTGTKDSEKSLESSPSTWKEAVIKYTPYIGAAIIAGIAAVFGIHSYRKA